MAPTRRRMGCLRALHVLRGSLIIGLQRHHARHATLGRQTLVVSIVATFVRRDTPVPRLGPVLLRLVPLANPVITLPQLLRQLVRHALRGLSHFTAARLGVSPAGQEPLAPRRLVAVVFALSGMQGLPSLQGILQAVPRVVMVTTRTPTHLVHAWYVRLVPTRLCHLPLPAKAAVVEPIAFPDRQAVISARLGILELLWEQAQQPCARSALPVSIPSRTHLRAQYVRGVLIVVQARRLVLRATPGLTVVLVRLVAVNAQRATTFPEQRVFNVAQVVTARHLPLPLA
jgi:hypothetical protein